MRQPLISMAIYRTPFKSLAMALCFLGALPIPRHAIAESLPALLHDAGHNDPSVLEAHARFEQSQMQTGYARAQHWPTLGLSTTRSLAGTDANTSQFTGVTGRVNLFSAGAISARIKREEHREKSYADKIDESRENVATTVAEQYLMALRAKEMLAIEQRNFDRHQKIITDLKTVVRHDQGRRYELVQAQARALQVRMRMVQYEKNMRLALNKLTRYTQLPVTLQNPFSKNWRDQIDIAALKARNPSIMAQMSEMQAARADLDHSRRSRWPSVDIVGSVGRTKNYGPSHSVNLVVHWNFMDRGAHYIQRSAAKQLAVAENRLETLTREIDERSHTAEVDMQQSVLQSEAAAAQIEASAEVVELYGLQFRIGRRSLLELLNAYQELASVEASKVQADNDHRHAIMTYLAANSALMNWANSAAVASSSSTQRQRSQKNQDGTEPFPLFFQEKGL